jgi:uncharacterized membrane protein (DUF106 family)
MKPEISEHNGKTITWQAAFILATPVLLGLIAFLTQLGINNILIGQEKMEKALKEQAQETRSELIQTSREVRKLCETVNEHELLLHMAYQERERYFLRKYGVRSYPLENNKK